MSNLAILHFVFIIFRKHHYISIYLLLFTRDLVSFIEKKTSDFKGGGGLKLGTGTLLFRSLAVFTSCPLTDTTPTTSSVLLPNYVGGPLLFFHFLVYFIQLFAKSVVTYVGRYSKFCY